MAAPDHEPSSAVEAKVLLIDDNADDLLLAKRAIRQALPDAVVDAIGAPDEFAARMAAGDFTVVVTDFRLRWSDGLRVLREVAERHGSNVPVILFTNTGTEEVAAEALRSGAFDYIIKNATGFARLPRAVRAALDTVELRRRRAEQQAERARYEQRLRELLERERAARAEAERASRVKDQFIATISHELRTPLSAILNWSQLLLRGAAAGTAEVAELREGLESILRNARVQAQLVDDLLDTSRIESGQLRLDLRPVGLAEVVRSAVQSLKPEIEEKGVAVDVPAADADAASTVTGDPARLQQVVGNLLSNALKFTPRGGRVAVSVRAGGAGDVELTVADTGIGIAPDFLPHVFDRFRQADATTTRHHGGVGLGLAIVKQLVELHGGTVRAESAGRGRGATFVVRLPVGARERSTGA